jgi:ribonuclease Z
MPRLAGIRVEGLSIGGVETSIDLPELKLCFDIGRSPDSAVLRPTVLFTHAHMDHMGGVAWHAATRALRGMPAPTYVVPRENARDFEELFAVWRRLDRSELDHRVVPLSPGEEWMLPNGLAARPFRSPHRAPCQGYALVRRRKHLRAEFAGLPQEEIRRLRQDGGVDVTEVAEIPELAFTGDTLIDVLEREEIVRRARLLILECTFLDDRVGVADARSTGHVHLDEIAERAQLFANEAILLTHFSARYTPAEIVAALDQKLPPELRARVTPLLAPTPVSGGGSASVPT